MGPPEYFIQNYEKILITGASGFIGTHLMQRESKQNRVIHAINRKYASFPIPVQQYNGDIHDKKFIQNCLEESQPETIFHLAALKERSSDIDSIYSSVHTNILGTLNILSSAVNVPSIKAIVVLGTAEEYGHNKCPFTENMRELPVSPYSLSKMYVTHLCEYFFSTSDVPVVILRPTIAYGPGQGTDMFVPSLITSLLDDKPFNMTLGEQTRDFVYVDDVVDSIILAAKNPHAKGQVINIGSGIPIKIADIAKKIEKMMGKKGLVNFGGNPYRKNEVMNYYVDLKKAENILGWTAKTSLEDGLNKTIAYYQDVKGI